MVEAHASRAREGTDVPGTGTAGVVLRGVPWATYEALVATEDENPGLRLTYCEGWLEIMRPSGMHENVKKMLARLLVAYADERGIVLNGFGSTTFRDAAAPRGLEPDECYVLAEVPNADPIRPDLAIEVAVSAWKLDRLRARGWGYATHGASSLLPALDVDVSASFVGRRDQGGVAGERPSASSSRRRGRRTLRQRAGEIVRFQVLVQNEIVEPPKVLRIVALVTQDGVMDNSL